MPPSQELTDAFQKKIDGFGPKSFEVLIALLGVDKIEDTELADKTLIETAPKAITAWESLTEEQRIEVAGMLYKKQHNGEEHERPIFLLRNQITRACHRIISYAKILRGTYMEPLTEEDLVQALNNIKGLGEEGTTPEQLISFFPGLKDEQPSDESEA